MRLRDVTVNDHDSFDWRVEIPTGGRDGYVRYYEGPHTASFYWEFGGDDIVVILHTGQSGAWSSQYPWAASRKRQIVERVIQEVIRQQAPTCRADIDEVAGYVYFRARIR